MMKSRIEGIFSQEVLTKAYDIGVQSYGFDLRPKSFNFCQLHKLIEMLKSDLLFGRDIFLCFSGQSETEIRRTLEEIDKELPFLPKEQITLEFWGQQHSNMIDDIGLPYILHYEFNDLSKVDDYKNLSMMCLDLQTIEDSMNNSSFDLLAGSLQSLGQSQIKIMLRYGWTDYISHGVLELIRPDYFSLIIDQNVQTAYRQIDMNKFTQHFEQIDNQIRLANF